MLYLFDIDGTLLLTGGAGSRAINRIFAERYGLDGAMEQISAGGKTDPQIIREIFRTRLDRDDVGDAEITDILREYVPLLCDELSRDNGFRTMPSIEDALGFLETERTISLGIATGNIRLAAQAKLEHIDMWTRFPTGGFGDDAGERWGIVARAIERAQAHAGRQFDKPEVIVVGDTVLDILAARACGVTVLAVATGRPTRAELEAAKPDAVFDTLAELPAWHRQYVS